MGRGCCAVGKRGSLWLRGGLAALLLFLLFLLFVPVVEFSDPFSMVLEGEEGVLLDAHIAKDGQWRFPPPEAIPPTFQMALLTFEDQYFYRHCGVNPLSLVQAFVANVRAGKVVRGGSTITMQVVRLARKGRSRTYGEKLLEILLALRLEVACSKGEILTMYVANAPFGGNVVGLEAASWRYFQRPPGELSLAESALLAVLPNAPSAMHPSRNRALLRAKRDRLLARLQQEHKITETDYLMALDEPLPLAPQPLPHTAGVLGGRLSAKHPGERMCTAIRASLQREVKEVLERHLPAVKANGVNNLAALVMDVHSGSVVAYAGNVCDGKEVNSPYVDMVAAPRSTGSILKPFLYGAMLDEGALLPDMLVDDIPINFAGYTPKNYTNSYLGALPAWQALSRSLNVPAVGMLSEYGVARFYALMRQAGITSFRFPASHYGLSLILGGGEASLLEISALYANMARHLNGDEVWPEGFSLWPSPGGLRPATPFSRAAIFCTFEAMKQVHRPTQEAGWAYFRRQGDIAWKTGTSFGFRDAWAVGVTPGYVVGVWVGNADGEGRPGLTGTATAAPVMFDLFHLLPEQGDFEMPLAEMVTLATCRESGHPVSRHCPDTVWRVVPEQSLKVPACPYHKRIHLDRDTLYRVNSACYPLSEMVALSWFELPPVQSFYYRRHHPGYRSMPSWHPGCEAHREENVLNFVYPTSEATLYLPRKMDGSPGKLIMDAAHRDARACLYWYIDNCYMGKTTHFHTMACYPEAGPHRITILDSQGNTRSIGITVYHRHKEETER
ncbi:MAG: penicillin-binding protein 1C [Bacteroidetes bacterium]|nr:MAG: penicillin-binding protein 1C [Bacteroidota bacterium]